MIVPIVYRDFVYEGVGKGRKIAQNMPRPMPIVSVVNEILSYRNKPLLPYIMG